jgi:hypothetical protein
MDFADALHLARSEGCGALISFDRQLALVAAQGSVQLVHATNRSCHDFPCSLMGAAVAESQSIWR